MFKSWQKFTKYRYYRNTFFLLYLYYKYWISLSNADLIRNGWGGTCIFSLIMHMGNIHNSRPTKRASVKSDNLVIICGMSSFYSAEVRGK